MSQNSVIMPTSGIVSGVTMAQDINSGFDSIRTMYSGASAPSADTPEEGQLWLDSGTSTAYKILRIYDGAQWLARAYLDDTNHIYLPPVGGGSLTVSSTAPNLGGATEPAAAVSISGTTTITSFGTNALNGQFFFVTFQGVLTLTYNATSFILPGKANITTAAGDMSIWQYLGSGNWQCLVYQPVATLVGSVGTVTGAFITNNIVSPTQITANQNDYSPTGNANAVVLELTSDGLADYLITGIANGTSGRHLIVRNSNAAGGGRFIFPNQSTSSLAANRFKMPGCLLLTPGQQIEFIYDNSVTAWVPQNFIVSQPSWGSFRNLQAGNASAKNFTAPASPNQQYKITADSLVVWDADNNPITLANVSVTPDITVTGANGIDSTAGIGRSTGAWYSAWVIYNALTNTAAGLFSTTSTNPTMPSGYTFKARVSWATTQLSTTKQFAAILQQGDEVQYILGSTQPNYPVVQSTANASAVITVSLANFVPPTAANIRGIAALPASAANSSTLNYMTVGSNSVGVASTGFGTSPTSTCFAPVILAGVTAAVEFDLLIESTAQNIFVANVPSVGSLAGFVYARGWRDNL